MLHICRHNLGVLSLLILSTTEFADPPPSVPIQNALKVSSTEAREVEPLVPSQAPTTLMQWAVLILNTPNPTLKVCARVKFFLAGFAYIYK